MQESDSAIQTNEKFAAIDAELLNQFEAALSSNNSLHSKFSDKIMSGKIIEVNKKQNRVIVDVGLKAEGVVGYNEFIENGRQQEIEAGEEYDFYVESIESAGNVISISHEKVNRERSWANLKKAFADGDVVEGVPYARVKGGFAVDFNCNNGFCPASHMDVRDIQSIIGVPQPFKVLSMDEEFRGLIVSRRRALENARHDKKSEFIQKIKEGDVLEGIVKNITNYGAFIDLEDMDGLLHIADITWERIVHPSQVLKTGDKIKVKILSIDHENKRISLGMKQLQDNPWLFLEERYAVGTKVSGKVTNITDYGIFVELEQNVDGLIHSSEISWTKDGHIAFLNSVKVGDQIESTVTNIDVNSYKISLSRKQLHDNPWRDFIEQHKIGDLLKGTVSNITNFGLFLTLGTDINGLLHISDLSWSQATEKDLAAYKIGDELEVMYLSGDAEKQRVSVGLKQIGESPIEKFKTQLMVGATVTCTIVDIDPNKVDVTVFDTFRSSIKKANIAYDKSEQRTNRFSIGDRVDAAVISFDIETGMLQLSIRDLEESERKQILEKYGSTSSGATLANILGGDINSNSN